jgi:hypothetical protein
MTSVLILHALIIAAFGAGLFLAYRGKGTLALGFTFIVACVWMYQAQTLLGRPVPMDTPPDEAVIVSMIPVPGTAIYLYAVEDGASEPSSIRLPWSMPTAQKIGEKLQEQSQKGGAVRYRKPAIPGDEGSFKLDLPPEPAPKQPMQEYGE